MSEAPTLVDAGRREAAGIEVGRMYEQHSRSLYGLCRMLLRDPAEAEDAMQATFLAAHSTLLRGGGPRDEHAWLAAIARNECRGRIRDRMSRPLEVSDDTLETVADPGPVPGETWPDPAVSRALEQLPENQRDAVVLHDVYGLRAREVGGVLGMSVPAVEALLFRGRRHLRGRLTPVRGALVVPVGMRETLTQLIPGFAAGEGGGAVTGGAAVAGAGLLAKLTAAPAAAKIAAGVAAIAAAGSVAAVKHERPSGGRQPQGALTIPVGDGDGGAVEVATALDERTRGGSGSSAGDADDRSGRSGTDNSGRDGGRGDGEDGGGGTTSSGPGQGTKEGDDDGGHTRAAGSGSSGSGDTGGSGSGDDKGGSSGSGSDDSGSGSDDSSGSSGGSGGSGSTETSSSSGSGSGSGETTTSTETTSGTDSSSGSGGSSGSGTSGSGSGSGSSGGSGSGSSDTPDD